MDEVEKQSKNKDIYTVPYNLMPYGSKVIIYGAGKVGDFYARNIIDTKRCNLVAIIDSNTNKKMYGVDISICPPSMIKAIEYDYILIAVESYSIAQEIIRDLVNIGVCESKIIWNGNLKIPEHQKKTQEYEKFLERNYYTNQNKCFLFMLPEHGNAGDYAIGYAEMDFLRQYFPQYKLVTVTTTEWVSSCDYIIKHIGKDDLIFLNGGGYIGDLWADTPNYKSIIEAFPENIKMFFPNTLTYKKTPNELYTPFKEEMNWFANQKSLYTFFRDMNSYKIFNSYDDRSYYFPDMVLYNHYKKQNVSTNLKILFCFRNDIEKVFDKHDELRQRLEQKGFAVEEMDIHACRYISQQAGYAFVESLSKKMQEFDCVITDRLHGMLLATVSDVPCVAFDNLTHKISGVYEWIKHIEYVRFLELYNTEDVLSNILDVIRMKDEAKYNPLMVEFENMAKTIHKCIRGE